MLYPQGYIITKGKEILGDECHITKECGYYLKNEMTGEIQKIALGEGEAYEKNGSSFINKTSYIENCDTSATGRALGMAGIGIDTSIASFEEVANAIQQQDSEKTIDKKMIEGLQMSIKSKKIADNIVDLIISQYGYKNINEIKIKDYMNIVNDFKTKVNDQMKSEFEEIVKEDFKQYKEIAKRFRDVKLENCLELQTLTKDSWLLATRWSEIQSLASKIAQENGINKTDFGTWAYQKYRQLQEMHITCRSWYRLAKEDERMLKGLEIV